MSPPKRKQPTKSEMLAQDVNKMEDVMKMLRSQIDEERAKVHCEGPRWAAGAEGPIKIDSHGKFARKILSKKKPGSATTQKKPTVKPPTEPAPTRQVIQPEENMPKKPSPKRPHVEIVVEKQGGALWGNVPMNVDDAMPVEGGGALWGPLPPEAREYIDMQNTNNEEEEEYQNETHIAPQSASRTVVYSTSSADAEEPEEIPRPSGGGGALWGPHPDESAESEKFQKILSKMRGEEPKEFPVPETVETSETVVEARPEIVPKKIAPSGFTYFDMLVTKDIIDDTRIIDQK